jgi:hypothetical protein
MSNRQMEECQEQEFAQKVASALGISLDDLNEVDWDIDENTTNDGAMTGYNVTFSEHSNLEVLGKIVGLNGGRWIRIGPID